MSTGEYITVTISVIMIVVMLYTYKKSLYRRIFFRQKSLAKIMRVGKFNSIYPVSTYIVRMIEKDMDFAKVEIWNSPKDLTMRAVNDGTIQNGIPTIKLNAIPEQYTTGEKMVVLVDRRYLSRKFTMNNEAGYFYFLKEDGIVAMFTVR